MEKIAVYGQYLHENSVECFMTMHDCFRDHGCEVHIEKEYLQLLEGRVDFGESHKSAGFDSLDDSYDLLVSMGGDGTILRAISYIGKLDIPIVGINTGRLGFLATIQKNAVQGAIEELMAGKYSLSRRTLLSMDSDGDMDGLQNFALNEVTVSRMNTTSMIQIETHVDGEMLTKYWADGLIISTPTGSTGYSLSCGGPVLSPSTQAFIITPIAPHNLNARPLIIPDSKTIEVKVMGRQDEFLTSLDNRIASFPDRSSLTFKKASFTANLVKLENDSFIKTIRNKLLWGEDKRN